MKKIFYILVLASMTSVACSDWTDIDTIGTKENTPESINPAAYAKYAQALRDYKASDHKVTYVTYYNVETALNQSHHLTSLPDSVDFIEMMNPDVTDWVAKEMDQLRKVKGMRFTLRISAADIQAAWDKQQAEKPDTVTKFATYQAKCISDAFDKVAHYGYDGVCVSYNGSYTEQMTDDEKSAYLAAQEQFMAPVRAWIAANPDKLFFFEGNPQFVADKELIKSAAYVILPTRNATRLDDLTYAALRAMRDETMPACKFLFAVETLPDEEADVVTGRFGAGYQIKLASEWMTQSDTFNKSGLMIWNIQRDYFDTRVRYFESRKAIKTMNPNA